MNRVTIAVALITIPMIALVAKTENHVPAYRIVDGDTLIDTTNGDRIRLARIDAPEMPHHCRPGRQCVPGDPYAARDALQWAITRGTVQCAGSARDFYGRRLAECFVTDASGATVNLNDWMMASGHAQPYRRTPRP